MKGNWYRYRLYTAWVISLCGLFASLTFSELLQIEPCPLCWYQRTALFPLVLILAIAAYREDQAVRVYALPLALFGATFAIYQLSLQTNTDNCTLCVRRENPLLALISAVGFLLIALCFIIGSKGWRTCWRWLKGMF